MGRRTFSSEYKRQAVALIIEEGISVKKVSNELHVHENSLYRWVQEVEQHGERAFPGKGSRDYIAQNKLKKLEKENERLKEELEVLKKFQVFLKKNK